MKGEHAYTDSPDHEGHGEPLLNSHATPSSTVDDEGWSRKKIWSSRWSSSGSIIDLWGYWRLVVAGMLGIMIVLQFMIWYEVRTQSGKTAVQIGGDYERRGPTFATEIVKWNGDPEFTPLNATEFLRPEVQEKWETLYPAGTGFIGPNELTYNSTSVTHQLHCVWFMGKTFSAVVTGGDIPEPDDYEAHFLHCVDYMRQAAMCAGDVAIEPRGENDQPGHANLVNAFNGLHVCKDYRELKDYLEKQVTNGLRNILPLDD